MTDRDREHERASAESGAPPHEGATFRDHFSALASTYAAYRPTYPDALFDQLAAVAPARGTAWDCAAGSGQATAGLAARFARVIATDASGAQLALAPPLPNVEYRVAAAEASGIDAGSVDLVNVAQALHWLDRDRFYEEARRVLVPGGVLAVSSYGGATLDDPTLSSRFARFEHETMGAYWPRERAHVGEGLLRLPFPFDELPAPSLTLERRWTLDELLGYVRSWSATARYVARHGADPALLLDAALAPDWGARDRARLVRWPFVVRLGRVPATR